MQSEIPEGSTPLVPPTPPPKKRGRPPSGIDRKKQLRQAARRHRERGGFRVRRLQVELPAGLYYNISQIAERENETLRVTVTRLLHEAWKRDYVEKAVAEGSNRASAEKVADSMIASYVTDFERCFDETESK